MYGVCAVCAPRLCTLPPMCNDRVCLGGRFALLSIPEGTVQCGALLYHCWQPTVYVERGREMGVSLAHGLGWPLTHSLCSALSAAAEAQSSITLTCTETHTPVWEKCIYQAQRYANIGRHSNASQYMIRKKKEKKMHTDHTSHPSEKQSINTLSSYIVIIRVFLSSKGGIYDNNVLGNMKWDLTTTVPYMMFKTPFTQMT